MHVQSPDRGEAEGWRVSALRGLVYFRISLVALFLSLKKVAFYRCATRGTEIGDLMRTGGSGSGVWTPGREWSQFH